jgi:hypothetical protein
MTVNVSKPAINVREKLAELDKPTGIAGEAMLRAETPQEQFNLIGAGRRNLIINGAMNIYQRGSQTLSADGYALDRWMFDTNNTDELSVTYAQQSDAPDGFANSLKITVSTPETTLASDEYTNVRYRFEAQDMQQLAYGSSAAKHCTLSFWVKSSIAGQYGLTVYQPDAIRQFTPYYTVNQADTWEYKTIIIPPDASGTIYDDNGNGYELYFCLSVGSNYSSSTSTVDKWAAYASNAFFGGHEVDLITQSGATFQITGVQLELGKVATP